MPTSGLPLARNQFQPGFLQFTALRPRADRAGQRSRAITSARLINTIMGRYRPSASSGSGQAIWHWDTAFGRRDRPGDAGPHPGARWRGSSGWIGTRRLILESVILLADRRNIARFTTTGLRAALYGQSVTGTAPVWPARIAWFTAPPINHNHAAIIPAGKSCLPIHATSLQPPGSIYNSISHARPPGFGQPFIYRPPR